MANAQFILKTTIWDGDFKDLSCDAQRAYVMLGSQKSISLCGAVALGIKRWSNLAADDTPKRVRKALDELVAKRWVLVDEDTEEVLLRTYTTHAGALKMPNVVVGLCRDYTEILSAPLRRVVMAQIRAEHLVGIRNRKRIPAQFITEYEQDKGEPFPLVPGDDPEEPQPEGMPITNGEPLPEPQSEPKPIQPTTDTTDNRQPTTDVSKSVVPPFETSTVPADPAPRKLGHELFDHWRTTMAKNGNVKLDDKRRARIAWAIKHYPPADLFDAINGCSINPHNTGADTGRRHDDIAIIFRDAAHVERFRDEWRTHQTHLERRNARTATTRPTPLPPTDDPAEPAEPDRYTAPPEAAALIDNLRTLFPKANTA